MIESDTIANAIVASAYSDSLDPTTMSEILDTIFELELVPDVQRQVETTLYNYLCWKGDATYQELLLEFLGDPVRAGKYVLDGTKFATLAKILLDFLIWPPKNRYNLQVP